MPELPEVESARAVIERSGLDRRIADVDDADTYECRPHAPGELRDALVGRRLTAARRRGKLMWCETSGVGRSRRAGPELALHLGMSGRILISRSSGDTDEGGDYGPSRGSSTRKPAWDRFTLTFADGGFAAPVRQAPSGAGCTSTPDVDALGPDAERITLPQFRDVLARGEGTDQGAIA